MNAKISILVKMQMQNILHRLHLAQMQDQNAKHDAKLKLKKTPPPILHI